MIDKSVPGIGDFHSQYISRLLCISVHLYLECDLVTQKCFVYSLVASHMQ